jgi:hypothetical protein
LETTFAEALAGARFAEELAGALALGTGFRATAFAKALAGVRLAGFATDLAGAFVLGAGFGAAAFAEDLEVMRALAGAGFAADLTGAFAFVATCRAGLEGAVVANLFGRAISPKYLECWVELSMMERIKWAECVALSDKQLQQRLRAKSNCCGEFSVQEWSRGSSDA